MLYTNHRLNQTTVCANHRVHQITACPLRQTMVCANHRSCQRKATVGFQYYVSMLGSEFRLLMCFQTVRKPSKPEGLSLPCGRLFGASVWCCFGASVCGSVSQQMLTLSLSLSMSVSLSVCNLDTKFSRVSDGSHPVLTGFAWAFFACLPRVWHGLFKLPATMLKQRH